MQSTKTLKNEFNHLLTHLPEALDLENSNTLEEYMTMHFNIENNPIKIEELDIFPLEHSYFDTLFQESEDTKGEILFPVGIDRGNIDSYLHEDTIPEKYLREIIINFGNDAFGCYLPMHRFFTNKKTPWGIYLFPELISSQAKGLHKIFSKEISQENCIRLYLFCVYRHELFHYQTEKFATAFEISNRKPYYLNYIEKIYSKYARTEDWLEECLAESSVLNSKLVSNRSQVTKKLLKKIYEYDLKSMPPGYRDYHCKKYGNEKIAHQYLAAQILHLEKTQPLPTETMTIKSNFIAKDKLVPVYYVTGFNRIRRIQ